MLLMAAVTACIHPRELWLRTHACWGMCSSQHPVRAKH